MARRPDIAPTESLADYLRRLDVWKADGTWVPASNGTETPFMTRTGHRLLYCYQPRTGAHAYLDLDTDIFIADAEIARILDQ